jgi:hypothetical protein
MRKLFAVLILALLIVPTILLAAETAPKGVTSCDMRHDFSGADWKNFGINCPSTGACSFSTATDTCGTCCLLDTIYTVTDWIFILVIVIAVIFVVLGAFNIMTAGGSPEKVQTGRNYIVYAVIGLIVALLAKAIPGIARSVMGM